MGIRKESTFRDWLRQQRYLLLYLLLLQPPSNSQADELSLSFSFEEELPRGTVILNLRDHRKTVDNNNNSEVHYSVLSMTPRYPGLVDLDSETGLLTTARVIDREDICPQQLTCLVQMNVAVERLVAGSPSGVDLIRVDLSVLDLNDNSPYFRQPLLNELLPESIPLGFVFEVLPAIDLDAPPNGVVRYLLLANPPHDAGPFRLVVGKNRITNEIVLNVELVRSLDREDRDLHRLTVTAVDGGRPQRTGTLLIDVTVTDENDNSPKFPTEPYEVVLPSAQLVPVGSRVVTITAVDRDAGLNGLVRYFFSRKTESVYGSVFEVHSETGDITTKARLDEPSYTLVVTAEDLGVNSIASTTVVHIHVETTNDYPPLIEIRSRLGSESTLAEILENNKPNLFIARVTVTDRDTGKNGEVRCALLPPNDDDSDFALVPISEKTFHVVARKSFDREEKDRYVVGVECADGGDPSLTSTATVNVTIVDEDDNAPEFSHDVYHCSLTENNERDVFLVQVEADDPDYGVNGRVDFFLDADADRGIFRIDQETGEIFVLECLDRENVDHFRFHVIAQSGRSETVGNYELFKHVARCLVEVTVLDVGDEPPRFFQSTYSFEVVENRNSGIEVGRVTARDRDLPPYNTIVYHLESADSADNAASSGNFAINPVYGVIYTRQILDRETISHYTMRVRATSADVASTTDDDVAVVFVRVKDVNDNPPVVTYPSADNDAVYWTGNVTSGDVIANVSAYDRDSGANAELTYSITSGNVRNSYSLNSKNGTLFWNASESMTSGYDCIDVLDILVKDGGVPISMSTASRIYVVFDCHDGSTDYRRKSSGKGSSKPDAVREPSFFGYYFLTITAALVVLIVILVIIVARVGVKRYRTGTTRRRRRKPVTAAEEGVVPLDDGGSSEETNDLVIRNKIFDVQRTISEMMDIRKDDSGHCSSFEVNYGAPAAENDDDDDDDSGSEFEDNVDRDSGCVDVSSV